MPDSLSTKELILLQNLEAHQSQRRLAKASSFSLGMTNMLLKRLIKKGYVKVTTLNGRTLRYMLTPIGFAEKMRRSYEFLVVSIRQLNEVRKKIQNIVETERDGNRAVWILGESELTGLAKEVLNDAGIHYNTTSRAEVFNWKEIDHNALIIFCDPDLSYSDEKPNGVKIIMLPNLVG